MIKLKSIALLWIILIQVNSGFTQKESFFAVGIVSGANSSVITFAIVTKIGDRFIGTQVLTEQFFMYYALGYWPCKANPNRENLFKKYNVPNCRLLYNSYGKVNGFYNKPFHELWKLRYKLHPQERVEGWSKEYYQPSAGQARYLHQTYDVLNVKTQYFVGEHLFQLLKDVQNKDWIDKYKAIPD